jgi:hypothetical protein
MMDQLSFLLAILRKSRSAFIRDAIEAQMQTIKTQVLMARDRDEDLFQAYLQSEMPDQQKKETEWQKPIRKSSLRKKSKQESMTS